MEFVEQKPTRDVLFFLHKIIHHVAIGSLIQKVDFCYRRFGRFCKHLYLIVYDE